MQFVEDDDTDLSQVTPEDVVELFSSVNTPLVAMPGRSSEEIRAYVLSHRGLGKTVEMHIYLHIVSSNESQVYACTGNPFPQSEYENVKAKALDFVETMGFIMDSNTFGGLNQEARIQLFREAPFTLAPAHPHMQEVDAEVPLDLLREKPKKPAGDTDFQVEVKVPPPGAVPPQDAAPLDIGFDDGSGHPADELYEAGLDDRQEGDTIPDGPDHNPDLPDDLFDSDTPAPVAVPKIPVVQTAPTDVEIDLEGPSGDSEPPVESVAWDEPDMAATPPDFSEEEPPVVKAASTPVVEPSVPPVEVEVDISMDTGADVGADASADAIAEEAAPKPPLAVSPQAEEPEAVTTPPEPEMVPVEVEVEVQDPLEESVQPTTVVAMAEEVPEAEPEAGSEMEEEVGGIRMDTGDEEEKDDSDSDEPVNPGPDRHEGRFLTPKARWARKQPLFYALDEPSPTDGRVITLLDIPALDYKDERHKALSEMLASL